MKIFRNAADMRAWTRARRQEGRTVGFVPTMGALHEGHTSLMRASVRENDVTVLSIFVNPAQFAPHEDFAQYPRAFEQDCGIARAVGIDAVYAPTATGMYPANYATYIEVERLQDGLCGMSRPHFFKGVATVVAKLFLAVEPDRAYFGLKDGQQAAIIRRMVRDLDFGVEIVTLPTIRDSDGLAVSSRNQYLSADERESALSISRALLEAKHRLDLGEINAEALKEVVHDELNRARLEVDYVELVDAEEMKPVSRVAGPVMLAVAAVAGSTRLIDNIRFDPAAASAQSPVTG